MSEVQEPSARAHCLAGLAPAERTRCEVWTRVCGYHRPVSAYNPGKQSEYADRSYYSAEKAGTNE